MPLWTDCLTSPDAAIRTAIEKLDATGLQVVLVVDENNRLLGTLTDGDMRRAFLKDISMEVSIKEVMNPHPLVLSENATRSDVLELMQFHKIHQVPIVNENHQVVRLDTLDNLLEAKRYPNTVILMAGGLGSRLQPLTEVCPKPLLKVGGKPILETILKRFVAQGFYRFMISVNYGAEKVKDRFGDGSQWGVTIDYLHEKEKLGTAGSLSLLPQKPSEPLIIMNGDLLTKINFKHLLQFHHEKKAAATLCVRHYDFQIPYGVVEVDHDRLLSIQEKPRYNYFVNAGIAVLEPSVLEFVSPGMSTDMPDLLKKIMAHHLQVRIFPIREYWVDIGRVEELQKAREEYQEIFGLLE